jgi:hypothetical protein
MVGLQPRGSCVGGPQWLRTKKSSGGVRPPVTPRSVNVRDVQQDQDHERSSDHGDRPLPRPEEGRYITSQLTWVGAGVGW